LGPDELKHSRWGWGELGEPDHPDLALCTTAQEREWSEKLTPINRQKFLLNRFFVRRWLANWLNLEPQKLPLFAPPGQPPSLHEGFGMVNWSHSANRLLLGWSFEPFGVDLERADRPVAAKALLGRFFPPIEQTQLAHLKENELQQAVLRSWVAKEALIKQRRGSIASELGHWWMASEQPKAKHLPSGKWWPVQVQRVSWAGSPWLLGWSGVSVPELETLVWS
jgi:phosphopantetheinyl transferase